MSCSEAKLPLPLKKSAFDLLPKIELISKKHRFIKESSLMVVHPVIRASLATAGLNLNANSGSYRLGAAKPLEDKLGVVKIYIKLMGKDHQPRFNFVPSSSS
jgi:hypothetical protein